jgi:hypothetical protein
MVGGEATDGPTADQTADITQSGFGESFLRY